MNFSDEQVKDMLEMKEQIIRKIEKYQKEIQMLEKQIIILDSIVKQSSFTKASDLAVPSEEKIEKQIQGIPITRGNQGEVIANAYVTDDQVSIVLDESINVDESIPPFKTFFIDRIIGEMKKKDNTDANNGSISSDSVIDYILNKTGSNIREIIIKNYRQKERINEIINTAGWSLSRMLDNANK